MSVKPVFDPKTAGRPMRVAAFMSGSGTNIIKLIERQKALKDEEGLSPFEVIFIFSDRSDGRCTGEKIAFQSGIPYFSYDIRRFHQMRFVKRTVLTPEGLAARKAYDRVPETLVRAFEIDVIALGGYMSYTTLSRCVNVHPADLSLRSSGGQRTYVGDHAVYDAVMAGEKTLRASTLWTDEGVDSGPLLMVSEPISVKLPDTPENLARHDHLDLLRMVEQHQESLKEKGDWKIFPRTIEMIARGRFGFDEDHRVYVDGHPVPDGYRETP